MEKLEKKLKKLGRLRLQQINGGSPNLSNVGILNIAPGSCDSTIVAACGCKAIIRE